MPNPDNPAYPRFIEGWGTPSCPHEVVGAIWIRRSLKAMCQKCGAIVRDYGKLPPDESDES